MAEYRPKPKKIVIIGASTGGPFVVEEILKSLPRHLDAAIIIVQHISENLSKVFADNLRHSSSLAVHESENEDILLPGSAILIKGGTDYKIVESEDKKKYLLLKADCSGRSNSPNIDIILRSATEVAGKNVIGIILSGMGKDGLEGAREVKNKGGVIIIEDRGSSTVYGMPGSIEEKKLFDYILSPKEITKKIIEISN